MPPPPIHSLLTDPESSEPRYIRLHNADFSPHDLLREIFSLAHRIVDAVSAAQLNSLAPEHWPVRETASKWDSIRAYPEMLRGVDVELLKILVLDGFADLERLRGKKQTFGALLSSLLSQLCRRTGSTVELDAAYNPAKKDGAILDDAIPDDALHRVLEVAGSTYVVVDFLDECPRIDDARPLLLDRLSRLTSHSSRLRLLVTSRTESDIEEAFVSLPDV